MFRMRRCPAEVAATGHPHRVRARARAPWRPSGRRQEAKQPIETTQAIGVMNPTGAPEARPTVQPRIDVGRNGSMSTGMSATTTAGRNSTAKPMARDGRPSLTTVEAASRPPEENDDGHHHR